MQGGSVDNNTTSLEEADAEAVDALHDFIDAFEPQHQVQKTRLLPAPESNQTAVQSLLNTIEDQDMLSRLSDAAYLGNLLTAGVTLSANG